MCQLEQRPAHLSRRRLRPRPHIRRRRHPAAVWMSVAPGMPQDHPVPRPCKLRDIEAARAACIQLHTVEWHHMRGLARATMTCTGSAPTPGCGLTPSRWHRPPPSRERNHSQMVCKKYVVEVLHK